MRCPSLRSSTPVRGQGRRAELLDRFLAKLIDFVLVGVVYGIIAAILAVGVAIGTGSSWVAALVTIALGINNDTAKRQAWHDQLGGGTRVVKIG